MDSLISLTDFVFYEKAYFVYKDLVWLKYFVLFRVLKSLAMRVGLVVSVGKSTTCTEWITKSIFSYNTTPSLILENIAFVADKQQKACGTGILVYF